jgi:hypothetical protein
MTVHNHNLHRNKNKAIKRITAVSKKKIRLISQITLYALIQILGVNNFAINSKDATPTLNSVSKAPEYRKRKQNVAEYHPISRLRNRREIRKYEVHEQTLYQPTAS